MQITTLKLQNFRNHKKREFEFDHKTVVIGENGSGKSNMLEAIYMLATGKSFRAEKEEEMISYGGQFSIITGQFQAGLAHSRAINEQITNAQISLTDGTMGVTRKKFEINGVAKRMIDFLGQFRAVLFGPEDMELVTGSPSGRRRYLDFVISQTDREYRRCLISYEKGLRQRNKLLERIREGFATRNQLFFWDRLLIKDGEYLTRKRGEYLDFLNNPHQPPPDPGGRERGGYTAVYDKSVISESRLKQYEVEEVAAAATLVGPHRDDFVVTQITNSKSQVPKDVSKYGSRGEQRMAVMWLKRGELNFLKSEGEMPVLLLDDIFSELDHKHRTEIETEIKNLTDAGGQVIVTAADEHLLPKIPKIQIIRLGPTL